MIASEAVTGDVRRRSAARWLVVVMVLGGIGLEWMGVAAAIHYSDLSAQELNQPMNAAVVAQVGMTLLRRIRDILPASALGIDGLIAWSCLLFVLAAWLAGGEQRWLRVTRLWVLWLCGLTSAVGTVALVLLVSTLQVFRSFDPEIAKEGGYLRAGAAMLWWACLVLPSMTRKN